MSAIARPGDWQARPMVSRSTSRSHVGLVRRINEDRVFDWPEGGVWAIADGMGGHRGGDLAAQSVIDALRTLAEPEASGSPDAILAALQSANAAIYTRNVEHGEQAGATAVTLSLYGEAVHVAWAGDSRCYRIRGNAVSQLTRDHSVVQELVDAGVLTPAAAANHPQANLVTRALGVDEACELEGCMVDFTAGDRFLLCSDGLSRSLEDGDLGDVDLDALADELMAKALRRDGTDNISLILIEPHARG